MGPPRSYQGLNRFLAQGLAPGALVSLAPEETHHLARVLRLKPGDQVLLLNGQGEEYLGTIERLTRQKAWVRVNQLLRQEPPPSCSIILALPLLKKEHTFFLAEKAVELGVTKLIPFLSKYSVVKPGARFEERLRARTLQALKQSRRLWALEILAPRALRDLEIEAAGKFVAYEKAQGRSLKRALKDFSGPSLALISGPEGGFAPEEVALLEKRGFVPVSLGPYILRAETAAFYLMSQAHAWAYL